MNISKEGDGYRAVHITGPTHNTLYLQIGKGRAQGFPIEVLPPSGSCCHKPLIVEDVILAIQAGLASMNARLEASFVILHAQIVENDTWQPGIYEYLTRKIVQKIHEEE